MIFNGGADGTGTIEGVRIAVGSYNGTGGYGSSKKNKLTFDFVPKFFYINPVRKIGSGSFYPGICAGIPASGVLNVMNSYGGLNDTGSSYTTKGTTCSSGSIICELNGNTLTWYSNSDAQAQMNDGGMRYSWCAIG